jgi:DNA-binding GntR family transcriptional regulator
MARRPATASGKAASAGSTAPTVIPDDELERPEGVAGARLFVGRAETAWTLPEQIAAEIGERILDGVIAPGERIGEERLAQEFRVSRGPIRDALKILEHVGLVTIASRRGAIATPLTENDIREIGTIREGLLAIAIRGFAACKTPESLALLRQHIDTLASLTDDDRMALVWLEAVDRLVLFIAHSCGNGRVASLLTTLSLQSLRYTRRVSVPAHNTRARRRLVLQLYREFATAFERGETLEPLIDRMAQIARERTERSAKTFA